MCIENDNRLLRLINQDTLNALNTIGEKEISLADCLSLDSVKENLEKKLTCWKDQQYRLLYRVDKSSLAQVIGNLDHSMGKNFVSELANSEEGMKFLLKNDGEVLKLLDKETLTSIIDQLMLTDEGSTWVLNNLNLLDLNMYSSLKDSDSNKPNSSPKSSGKIAGILGQSLSSVTNPCDNQNNPKISNDDITSNKINSSP